MQECSKFKKETKTENKIKYGKLEDDKTNVKCIYKYRFLNITVFK